MLSHREGLPRNIMEFMACGRKVIATDIRGCRDLICNDRVGTLVKIDDYEATAKAIEKDYVLNHQNVQIFLYVTLLLALSFVYICKFSSFTQN